MSGLAKDDEKPSPMAKALLKLWNSLMFFSLAVLGFYLFVLKDDSVLPTIALGIIGLCIPPVVNIIRAINRRSDRKRKLTELHRAQQLEKLRQARKREREMLEQEELFSKREAAETDALKHVLKNVNMAAFKPK